MLDFMWVNSRQPTKCNCGSVGCSLIYKFGVDQIYSFGGIAILTFWRFVLKWPIHVLISAAHAQNQR